MRRPSGMSRSEEEGESPLKSETFLTTTLIVGPRRRERSGQSCARCAVKHRTCRPSSPTERSSPSRPGPSVNSQGLLGKFGDRFMKVRLLGISASSRNAHGINELF
jgi:hypothetical protein